MAANVDGVRPTSAVGPATGAGPADATKLDPSKGNATPATGMGLHASRGGPMSPAPTRTAQKTSGPSAVALPAKTRAAIRNALEEVNEVKFLLKVTVDRLIKRSNDDDLRLELVKANVAAQKKLDGARANLGQVIAREADRFSPLRSTLVPKEQRSPFKNQPPSITKVREFEAKVVNDAPPADRDEVARAILKSKELRAAGELARASAAMLAVAKTKNPYLNAPQTEERKSIVVDVRDCVTQARPEEADLAPDKLAEAQLARFKAIADSVTTPVGQFDRYLFAMLKDEVRASMNLDVAYLGKFDALVATYSDKLGPRY